MYFDNSGKANKTVLITGVAGFLGSSLADALLARGIRVIGVDNLNPQYDPDLKKRNIAAAATNPNFVFRKTDIRDQKDFVGLVQKEKPQATVHIAGSTGMKRSFDDPEEFFSNNVNGTRSVLEACRIAECPHVILASTASVYGETSDAAQEDCPLPPPANPYVTTKRLSEELVRIYAENHGIMGTILRLATVYGPRQRREMAVAEFVRRIDYGEPILLYAEGQSRRSHLFIDDCVQALIRAIEQPYALEIFNIGGGETATVNELVEILERHLGRRAIVKHGDLPQGVLETFSVDDRKAKDWLKYRPTVCLPEGLKKYIEWYQKDKIQGHWG